MLKRSFWLALAVVAGLIVWRWLQQRREDFGGLAPQLGSFESPPWPAPEPSAPLAQTAPQAAEPVVDLAELAAPEAEAAPQAAEPAVDVTELAAPAAEAVPQAAELAEPAAEAAPQAAEVAEPAALDGVVGYCVRCKTKRTIKDAHEETTESGRRAARGTCPVCGANMFTFLATED